jgi:diguanylate cyclase (GGDEF)-like protein
VSSDTSKSRSLTLSIAVVATVTLTLVGGFFYYGVTAANDDALKKQDYFIQSALEATGNQFLINIGSVTQWDDSITHSLARNDPWIEENLSLWMLEFYNFDKVYLLDHNDQPFHAVADDARLPPSAYAADQTVVGPYVREVRKLLEQRRTNPEADPKTLVAFDFIVIDGSPAMIAVSPLLPSTENMTVESGAEQLHVSIMYLADTISNIGARYRINEIGVGRVQPDSTAHAVTPVIAKDGKPVGFVSWKADRPGTTLAHEIAPAVAIAAILWAGLLAYIMRKLRRAFFDLEDSRSHAQFLACHDTLTGLPNRALFNERLGKAIATVRGGGKVALLYLDLDRFKHVNDTLGHPAGDELIRQVATRLSDAVRGGDTVARLGGDEFAVILPGIEDDSVVSEIADRLMSRCCQPFDLFGDQAFVGASIGVVISSGVEADPETIQRQADMALYNAKRRGRGRVQRFDNTETKPLQAGDGGPRPAYPLTDDDDAILPAAG